MNDDRFPATAGSAVLNGESRHKPGMILPARTAPGTRQMAQNTARSFRWLLVAGLVAGAGVLGAGALLGTRGQAARDETAASAPEPADAPEASAVSVKAVRPKRDPSFRVTVQQPAFVDAYYKDELMARVAGPLTYLNVDIGTPVKAGQVLAVIDVPDLAEDVRQKEQVVEQRRQELKLAEVNVNTAAAGVDFAKSVIPEKEGEVEKARATQRFRWKELQRFKSLAAGDHPAVTPDVVDERTEYYESAAAAVQEAEAAVQKARAGLSEAQAKLEAAKADVSLKNSLVDVARKDVDKAKALLGFATIRAPYDGVVTRRKAGPGTFIQNAATARTEPFLEVAKTDTVTVYMKVPDNYAPYVTTDTDAEIEIGVLPGCKIRGKVTRFSPSLQTPENDRTMRVEVDLFNGSREAFDRLVKAAKANDFADLKGRVLPDFPVVNGDKKVGLQGRLLPGMYGTMTLELQKFSNVWLVPSTALVSQGGRSFLYLVKDGKAVLTRVNVQVDDGRLAKVSVEESVDGKRVERDLTGREMVVVSNQGELTDGQAVKVAPSEW